MPDEAAVPSRTDADEAREAEGLLEAGLARYHAGDQAAAEALFRRALAIRPEDPTALYLLGLARFEAGDAEAAAQLLERVVALRPEHAQARLALAVLPQVGDGAFFQRQRGACRQGVFEQAGDARQLFGDGGQCVQGKLGHDEDHRAEEDCSAA